MKSKLIILGALMLLLAVALAACQPAPAPTAGACRTETLSNGRALSGMPDLPASTRAGGESRPVPG